MKFLNLLFLLSFAISLGCENDGKNSLSIEAGKSVEFDSFTEAEIEMFEIYGLSLDKDYLSKKQRKLVTKSVLKERNCVKKIASYVEIFGKKKHCTFVEKHPKILRGDCGAHFVDACREPKKPKRKKKKVVKKSSSKKSVPKKKTK